MKRILFIFVGLLCQLLAMAQWDTEHLQLLGRQALYNDNEYVLSIQYFNRVIDVKPYLSEPYMFRSVAKINLGDYEGAEADCNKALEVNPFVPYTYYLRGFARTNQNKFNEALSDINKALEFQPNDTSFLSYRIGLKEQIKEYRSAIEDVDLLYKLQPQRHKLAYFKGNYLLQLKDTTDAIYQFTRHNKLVPNSYIGWSALGLISMQRDDDKSALEYYNQSVSRKSNYSGDYINRGIIYKKANNFKQALLDFNNAVKLDSTQVLGYYNRGLLLEYLGDNNAALKDYIKTVELDSANYEARWKKAILELILVHNYKQAIADYKIILEKYPYFIPAISGIAEAEEGLGNYQKAFIYKQQIKKIESNKEYYKRKAKENIVVTNKMSNSTQGNGTFVKSKSSIFREFNANLTDSATTVTGRIQDKNVNVVNEKSFTFNTLIGSKQLRRTNLSRLDIDDVNKLRIIPMKIGVSNIEIPLSSEVISIHFENIQHITDSLVNTKSAAQKYFCRGIEFSLVKDYVGALNDFNAAIDLSPDFGLAYFCRATIREKIIENQSANSSSNHKIKEPQLNNTDNFELKEDKYKFNAQVILQDYDKVIQLSPDFTFAYFNKANLLCSQKNFKTAISNYSTAISHDPDFAEAYYNRGLTYLFVGEDAKGLADLSKAGELGIYSAYNLIQRFKK